MAINIPELDNIGYQELRKEAETRLPKDAPRWTDYNLSDPGITFLELFSWLGDIELYRLNRITPEHLRKFLALLGDHYPTAKPAKGIIVSTQSIDADTRINVGTSIEIETLKKKKLFRTKHTFYGNPAKIESIHVLGSSEEETIRILENKEVNPFYAFGIEPKENNYFQLHLNQMPSKRLKLYIEFEESDLPPYSNHWKEDYHWLKAHESVVLEWYIHIDDQSYLLTPQEDCTLNLRYSGMVSFIIREEMHEISTVFIECKLIKSAYMIAPFIKNIYLNTIEVEQVQHITETNISSGEASQELTFKTPYILDIEGEGVQIDTQNSEGDRFSWIRVDSLQHSKNEDRHFTYNNTLQKVTFGDGQRGTTVPKGEDIIAQYTISEGEQGVVPHRVDNWQIDNLNFYNPQSIQGGESIPTYEERFSNIIEHWRKPSQAVTLNDYESLAKMTTGLRVARAKALADRDNNRITVVVVPYSRNNYPLPDEFFCKRVCRFLDTRRLITTRIDVIAPRYTSVGLNLQIKAYNNVNQERVRQDIIKAIDEYLHPLRGGDHKEGWEFGRGVYSSDIYALLESVGGVSCILNVSFHGEGHYDGSKKVYIIKEESLIKTLNHRVTFVESIMACGGIS